MTDLIKLIIDRVSSYQFFNFVYPGLLLSGVFDIYDVVDVFSLNIWYVLLISYSLGMLASRIGSIVIENIFVCCKWMERFDYDEFNKAEKSNSKVSLHLEISNMFRTISATSLLILIARVANCIYDFGFSMPWGIVLIVLAIFILFCFSFTKQYEYLKKCIAANQS